MQASIDQILSGYDDHAPLSQASTIPAAWYIDPRIAELERLNVFSKTWQLVARTEQVKTPGQFVSTTVAGEPIVVVRGNEPLPVREPVLLSLPAEALANEDGLDDEEAELSEFDEEYS